MKYVVIVLGIMFCTSCSIIEEYKYQRDCNKYNDCNDEERTNWYYEEYGIYEEHPSND